jgi:outer membrane protein OmpA-like peptidoglycan-associated protein
VIRSAGIEKCCRAALAVGLLSAAVMPGIAWALEIEQRPYVEESTQKAIKSDPGWKEYIICEDKLCNPSKGLKAQRMGSRGTLISVRLSQDIQVPAAPQAAPVLPPVAPVQDKAGRLVHTVLFPFDSAAISPKESAALISATRDMRDPVVLEGFSCDLGTREHNDALALKRARSVGSLLKGKGIAVGEVSGVGKCCYVSEEKRLNRRVEVRSLNTMNRGGR